MKAISFLFFFLFFLTPRYAFAQDVSLVNPISQKEEIVRATIIKVHPEEVRTFDGGKVRIQRISVRLEEGLTVGKEVLVTAPNVPYSTKISYTVGDRLLIGYVPEDIGQSHYYIISYDRTNVLILLFILFLAAVLFIARKQGAMAVIGMGISFLLFFFGILPLVSKGVDPVFVSLIAVAALVPTTFYIAHGFNKKTTTAIMGTTIALVLTILLAKIFIDLANITGIENEDTITLLFAKGDALNLKGIMLSGIIIATLGALNDITISQSSIVQQLTKAGKSLSFQKTYLQAMAVGKDHIASVVNTLILVSLGSSFSTFLLLTEYPRPLLATLNNEIVVVAIVTTLVGSIGLIISIPITTYLACRVFIGVKKI